MSDQQQDQQDKYESHPELLVELEAILAQDTVQELTITPAMAMEILMTKNRRNRGTSRSKIDQYVADMKQGYWVDNNGDTVRFYDDGNLADGQHRLHACMESEVTIHTAIKPNLPADAIKTVDSGAGRSYVDALKMDNIDNASELVRSAKILIKWGLNNQPTGKTPTHSQISSFMESHGPQLTECVKAIKTIHEQFDNIVSVGELAAVRYRAENLGIDSDRVDAIIEGMLSGVSSREGAPTTFLFRNFVKAKAANKKADKLSEKQRLGLIVKCINMDLHGQVGSLKLSKKEMDEFPTLEPSEFEPIAEAS